MHYKYDIFLSHNRIDKPIVRQVARNLRGGGLRVFFDEDDVPPGADVATTIEWAVDKSKHVLLFLSAQSLSLSSRWVSMETALSLYRDPDARDGVLIPVILDKVDRRKMRPLVRRLNTIDLFGSSEERTRNYARILTFLGVDTRYATMMDWGIAADADCRTLLAPRIVHELPPAPRFVGRVKDLAVLHQFWQRDKGGVLTLVGIGGSGKTALLGEFLRSLPSGPTSPTALFVWSFYDEADPNAFLSAVYEYFTGQKRPEVKGMAWLLILKDTLTRGQRNLLILDGLERVQRVKERRLGDTHVFGELEDALLRDFLKRLVSGAGNTKAIVTTRFPVVDLDRWDNRGLAVVHLDELDVESCASLLASHRVRGTQKELCALSQRYGRHALTLDHLGSLLRRFFDGNPSHAPELSPVETHGRDPQSYRLRRVLQAYENCLPSDEKAALCRLCLFPCPVTIELLLGVFGGAVKVSDRDSTAFPHTASTLRDCIDSLVTLHLVLRDCGGQLTVHPAVRDHFEQLNKDPSTLHLDISTRLTKLAGRPGVGFPGDPTRLTLFENLIHHLVQAGELKRASGVYERRLGGMYHLSAIGEHARGLRILKMFPSIIDWDGYLRFRRGVGDVPCLTEWESAADKLAFYSANGRDAAMLLLGHLSDSNTSAAKYLMGHPGSVLYSDDYAPRFSALLLSKVSTIAVKGAHRSLPASKLMRSSVGGELLGRDDDYDPAGEPSMMSGGNTSIEALWDAEEFRLTGDFVAAAGRLEFASHWILRTSSAEHLLAYHLVRARLMTDKGFLDEADVILSDAVKLAREFDMRVLLVDLLLEQTRVAYFRKDWDHANSIVKEVGGIARELGTGHVWAIRATELLSLLIDKEQCPGGARFLKEIAKWRQRVRRLPAPKGLVVYLGELFHIHYEDRTMA